MADYEVDDVEQNETPETAKTVLGLARENRRLAREIKEILAPSQETKDKKPTEVCKHLLFEAQDIIVESNVMLQDIKGWLKALGK